nr:hypothetical protein Iba_chr05fCG5170 [Ipomoea batatas]
MASTLIISKFIMEGFFHMLICLNGCHMETMESILVVTSPILDVGNFHSL